MTGQIHQHVDAVLLNHLAEFSIADRGDLTESHPLANLLCDPVAHASRAVGEQFDLAGIMGLQHSFQEAADLSVDVGLLK